MPTGEQQVALPLRAYRRYAALPWGLTLVARIAALVVLVAATDGDIVAFEWGLAVFLLDVYVQRHVRDGRPLAELGLGRSGALRQLAVGGAVGAAAMGGVGGAFAVAGWYHVRDVDLGASAWAVFGYHVALYAAVAIFEEVLARGVLFRIAERWTGSWVALAVTSLLFGLGHLPNPNATLLGVLALGLEAGVLLGALFLAYRSLWAPIGAHFTWNLVQGPVLGLSVSGTDSDAFVDATTRGPVLWTGGAFGPEAGLVAVTVGVTLASVFLVLAVRRGRVRPPAGRASRPG